MWGTLIGGLAAVSSAVSGGGAIRGAAGVGATVRGPGGAGAPLVVGGVNITALKQEALAPGTASAVGPRPSGHVTVLVMGESSAAQWLTQIINKGVLQHDLKLVASHTKRAPYVTA